ncbi:MAG TPA: DUF4252 domain-containing protein [Muricauda sp.]|uniref:DUF4252 domain-containing protein n=1 Tax=Flagellimonas aurea TaxID=2915619 RepID=A0ABS3G441_9FLAO|nr:DUF4252 domain-containing protein [Allomuricauda aurea]MAO19028.1 hypothetical protein [Allomuricauda sp.]MBC70940.1 hypothetical protein [Allomuricauda sp.]MBO0354187.1 DUF4252 domain-containing protein [Allomuricauda aurea]HBU77144.1 DUF4252 domain-containing protein [Allomuricauda sp.]|tara:strand:- start:761 stop:1300 length:540 start_codon:yes stop_codon:yes gene_type:complete
MKKYILITVMALLPLAGFSQSLFDKFEDLDDVTSVVVNKSMFNLLAKIDVEVDDPEARDFMDIASSLKSLKVFTTENKKIGEDMKSSVDSYLKSSKMEELMRVKDKDANVKFYIKEGRDSDHVSELLMFVTGINNVEANGHKFETVILSLTGDIDLNKISSLTKKMNLPEELNEAGKKN